MQSLMIPKQKRLNFFKIEGSVTACDTTLAKRDALGVTETEGIEIIGVDNSQFLIIEVPVK